LIHQTIDSMMSNATSPNLDDVPAAMIETMEPAFAVDVGVEQEEVEDEEESLEGVEKLIQDLSNSDNAKVNAALDALFLDFTKDKEKCDNVTAWGGCASLVRLMKDRLKKAMKKIPPCGQVTELNELPELETIDSTLRVIVCLTDHTEMGRVGIANVGGVEAVVKVMKTFPKCYILQERACAALRNLTTCSIGKTKAIESGGIEALLAAVTTHLGSAILCLSACSALVTIASHSKQNTGLFISLGGTAAVAKVRIEWPVNKDVQTQVRTLANLIASEVKGWSMVHW
jgi:hypothetical protein